MMEFSFAQIEQVLAAAHSVPDIRRSAFSARLKHLQKLGFPPGTNTGRGRAAAYKIEHAFLLALALELFQLGYTPERGTLIVYDGIQKIAEGLADALASDELNVEPVYVVLAPAALSVALGSNVKEATIRVESAATFLERVGSRAVLIRRLSIINLADIVRTLINLADRPSRAALLGELRAWSRSTAVNTDLYKYERLRRFSAAHRSDNGHP